MAVTNNIQNAADRIANLSFPRQLGLMLGLAASVAIGVGVVLWSRDPNYMPLYSQLDQRDAGDIMDTLHKEGIEFKIDSNTGQLLVPAAKVQSARLKLASEGLPRENQGAAYDFLSNSNSFNYSQFMESARYKLALEKELARTIGQFHDIKAARVHLAIPRESAFVRDAKEPSASVFVDTYSNRDLHKQTVSSIINLVASSIPSMSASRVTVVDQNGKLLSEGAGASLFTQTDRYLDYRQTIEQQYARKIEDILTPILGFGRVNAKVSADIDFTSHEQTQEIFNPDQAAIRSEQSMEEKTGSETDASGVPGSLSNSPPNAASLRPNQGKAEQGNVSNNEQETSSSYRKQSTKNFEVDKTISHTRNSPGAIKRLSVAVLVDDRQVMDEKEKKMVKKPLTKEEIDQIKALVSDAIGIDLKRGDSLNVINSHFVQPEPIAPMPSESFWNKPMVWSIIKQVVGAIIVLILIFGLLRPLFRNLVTDEKDRKRLGQYAGGRDGDDEDTKALPTPVDYDGQIALLRQIVGKEPKRVAQVVKNWVEKG
ncbi:flagellar basal-body MS-ring/collar protein FliF [Legionella sp. W05-934-2]|jgi:flagellar M-ring protein FliF|uniref:flagellar basal-body MS-ring/collar protein FliF n=1 Tax=Legionella sp. W05-934-2 TaxID=1198649 RepID=UPI0034621E19